MKQFDVVQINKPKRSVFDLSHENKLTMNMGDLVPVFCQEVIPGDTFHVNTEMLMRMQPMIAPIMHRVNAQVQFFFVPYRIIWSGWEDFITGGVNAQDFPTPKIIGTWAQFEEAFDSGSYFHIGSLADYLGVPTEMYTGFTSNESANSFSALPFRAYQEIFNAYYRDENLTNSGQPIQYSKGSTDLPIYDAETIRLCTLRQRCWEKDYFTSSLPFAQRGNPVTMPLGGTAPVTGTLLTNQDDSTDKPVSLAKSSSPRAGALVIDAGETFEHEVTVSDGLSADLSAATSTTINDLRKAYALQRWLEKSARIGHRYVEQLLGIFGVRSSDARLQRPEYLGGGKMALQISEVLQTGQPTDTSDLPQGNMSGHGVTGGSIIGFNKTFEEHGLVIGICSVMPRTAYYQGLPKLFSKTSRYDYVTPDFANIGEVPVAKRELYIKRGYTADNNGTFGYQPRYSEYRYQQDQVHGEMRTDFKHWHMAREFTDLPALNESFVKANPTTRIYATEDLKYSKLIVQIYHNFKCIRALPYFGTPIP